MNTTTTKHALLSPSQASKWTQAPAEAIYNYMLSQPSTEAAERGTALHKVVTDWLVNFKLKRYNFDTPVDLQDLNDADAAVATAVVNELREWLKARITSRSELQWMAVEHKVNFDFLIDDLDSYKESGLEEAGFGTADLLIQIDNILYVIDFKFGRQMVSARANPQLMLYAAANLNRYKAFVDSLDSLAKIDFSVKEAELLIISRYLDKNLETSELIEYIVEQNEEDLAGLVPAIYKLNNEVMSKLAALRLIYSNLGDLPSTYSVAADLREKLEAAIARLEIWDQVMQVATDPMSIDLAVMEFDYANIISLDDDEDDDEDDDGTYVEDQDLKRRTEIETSASDYLHWLAQELVDKINEMRRLVNESFLSGPDSTPPVTPADRALFISNYYIPSDIKHVATVIVQPIAGTDGEVSIDSAIYTPAEVLEFVNQYIPTMDRILQIFSGRERLAPTDFNLSCKYSSVPGIFNMLLVNKFKEFIKLRSLPEIDLPSVLELAPDVERLIKEARQQAESVLSQGGKVPGFELRDGVRKPLKWSTDDADIIKQNCPGIDIYEAKLKSPAAVIKELTPVLGKAEAERRVESLARRDASNKIIVPELPIE